MATPPYTGIHASPSPPCPLSKQHEQHAPAPIASTSRLPTNAELQGRPRNQPTESKSNCWCGTAPRGRRAKGAAALAIALLAPAAVTASPVSPLSPKQTGKLRAVDSDSPSLPTPTAPPPSYPILADPSQASLDPPSALFIAQEAGVVASPRRRKRAAVLPKYEYVDGSWIINPTATLRGRTAGGGGDAALAGDDSATARATALQDNLDELTTTSTKTSASTRRTTSTSPSLSSPSAPFASPTPTTTANAPHGTPKIAAAASSTNFTIPDGWAATPRETNFYAVPVIVAMSVLVAITVVGTVVGSVVWRRKRRVKRNKEGEAEKGRMGRMMEKVGLGGVSEKKRSKKKGGKGKGKKGGGASGGGAAVAEVAGLGRVDSRASSDLGSGSGGGRRAITRANASAIPPAGRLRPRRRRQPRVEDEEQEEEERSALTGSQPDRSTTPHDTLTSRLQARLRNPLQGAPPSSSNTQQGPSTVFSRDLDRTSTHSTYSSGGRLSRTSSLAASLRSHENDPSRLLGQPQDIEDRPTLSRSSSRRSLAPPSCAPASPALSTHSNTSAFGSTVLDVPLPALGPPAYRPSSSTVQSTTRMSISRVPVPRIEVEEESAPSPSEPTARGVERDADGQLWHWPNEKPAARQAAPAPSRRSRRVPAPAPPPPAPEEQEEEDHPPADPSLYSAHLATDDKAVLARIREQATSPLVAGGQQVGSSASSSSRPEQLPEASAPAVEDEEEDDDLIDSDGFERLPLPTAGQTHPIPSAPPPSASSTSSASLLPAPPRPVDLAFDYTTSYPSSALLSSSDDRKTSAGPSGSSRRRAPIEDEQEQGEEEQGFLPVYQTRERAERSRVLEMASAPPADLLEEEEESEGLEEQQRWAEEERRRWEGREEEGEV